MRAFVLCFLLLFVVSIPPIFAPPAFALQREGIAAVVNDDIVSYSDVRYRTMMNLSTLRVRVTPNVQARIEEQSLNSLINETLQIQEAKKLGITVTKQQIQEGVEAIAQQNGFDYSSFRQKMQSGGIPISTLEAQVRAQIAWSYVVRRKLRPQINISEGEISSAFEQKTEQESQVRFRLAEIVLKGGDENELDNLARTIMSKLQDGAPFSLLAKQFSASSGAGNGGDLGWLTQDQLPSEYKYAVEKMQPGQVTPPLRTDNGYNIMLMLDKSDGTNSATKKIVAESKTMMKTVISQDMTLSMKQILIPVSMDEPKPVINAKIARAKQLKDEITGCDVMAEKSKNFLSPGTGDIENVKLTSLPPQVADVVKNSPIGQLTMPIQHRDGIAIMMVCDRNVVEVTQEVEVPVEQQVTPVKLDIVQDDNIRDEIADSLGAERLQRLQEHYLRDLRSAAYIENRIR